MNYIPTNRELEGTSYPPSSEHILNVWALLIAGILIVTASAAAATYASRLAIQHMGIDAAKIVVDRMLFGGSICAAVAGAGSTVLLAVAGRHRWAITYACWLALGIGTVVGTVLIDLGSSMINAMQEIEAKFSLTLIFPSFLYILFLATREGLARPIARVLKQIVNRLR